MNFSSVFKQLYTKKTKKFILQITTGISIINLTISFVAKSASSAILPFTHTITGNYNENMWGNTDVTLNYSTISENSLYININNSTWRRINTGGVRKVQFGYHYAMILMENGDLYSQGSNANGQLQIGNTTTKSTPTLVSFYRNIPGGVKDIQCGYDHSVVLTNNGQVYTAGENVQGQLGTGDANDRNSPTHIEFFDNINGGVRKIIAEGNTTLVLMNDGTLYGFGKNDHGNLGLGIVDHIFTPTEITFYSGKNGGIKDVVFGGNACFVIMNDGTVYGSGANGVGQLMLGYDGPQSTPQEVTFLKDKNGGLKCIETGESFTYAVMNDDTVYVCGSNGDGQLGINSTTNKHTPVENTFFVGKNGGIKKISLDGGVALVLMNDGTLYGIGCNKYGQLSVNSTTNQTLPVEITTLKGVGEGIKSFDSGTNNIIISTNNGNVYTCGYGLNGQLGLGGLIINKKTATEISSIRGINPKENLVFTAENWYSVKFKDINELNNEESNESTITFGIDKTKPTGEILVNEESAESTIQFIDTGGSNFKNSQYTLNNSSWQEYSTTFKIPPGNNIITAQGFDNANNASEIVTKNVYIKYPSKKPSINIKNTGLEIIDNNEEAIKNCVEYKINDSQEWTKYNGIFKGEYDTFGNCTVYARAINKDNVVSDIEQLSFQNLIAVTLDTTEVNLGTVDKPLEFIAEKQLNIEVNSLFDYKISAHATENFIGENNSINIINSSGLSINVDNNSYIPVSLEKQIIGENLVGASSPQNHIVRFKISNSIGYPKDIYKSSIKFIVEQK